MGRDVICNTISQKSCYIFLIAGSREQGVGSRGILNKIRVLFAYNP